MSRIPAGARRAGSGRRGRGFTLIEVLIALVITATALALGFGAVQGSARRIAQVEQTTLAGWAIDNVVSDISLRALSIEPGHHRFVETMLGRTLVIETDVQRTEAPPVLALDLSVTDLAAPDITLDTARVQTLIAPAEGSVDVPPPR